jgi:hypothetical protein
LESEARREGEQEGQQIVAGFQENPYIRNLARNPLMLSAICLVNYFEGGHLPEDRSLLYRLCVEGLLHNWDQRRGIHSEFSFDEKLRSCREVALAMQLENQAELDADRVQQIFSDVLGSLERAAKLLEYIRYRTGLLLERRPNIFGFAHLTFQEYLAARAIYEGNRLSVDTDQLVQEHTDGRWKEVIALYCGLAPLPVSKSLIEQLLDQADTVPLNEVLLESYFSSGSEILQDEELRQSVIKKLLTSRKFTPHSTKPSIEILCKFSRNEVRNIANSLVGIQENDACFSGACWWFTNHPEELDVLMLTERLLSTQTNGSMLSGESLFLLAQTEPVMLLSEVVNNLDMQVMVELNALASKYAGYSSYHVFPCSLAEIVFAGLTFSQNVVSLKSLEVHTLLQMVLRTLLLSNERNFVTLHTLPTFLKDHFSQKDKAYALLKMHEFQALLQQLIIELKREENDENSRRKNGVVAESLTDWVNGVDDRIYSSIVNIETERSK